MKKKEQLDKTMKDWKKILGRELTQKEKNLREHFKRLAEEEEKE